MTTAPSIAVWASVSISTVRLARRGIGSEAIRLTLPYAFDKLRCEQVYAEVLASNEASQQMLRSIGFEHTATLPRWHWQDNHLRGPPLLSDMAPIATEIQRLREEIEAHNYAYYVLSTPTISDYDFDQLLKQLERLEAEHPELITLDSAYAACRP